MGRCTVWICWGGGIDADTTLSVQGGQEEGWPAGSVLMTAPLLHLSGPATASVIAGVEAVIGALLGWVVVVCFVIGLAMRAAHWFRHSVTSADGSSSRQKRHVGREWADDVPSARGKRRRTDDPQHPFFQSKK